VASCDFCLSRPLNGYPDLEINHHPRDIKTQTYGIVRYGDMFTDCQLSLLTGLSDSLAEIEQDIYRDAIKSGLVDDCQTLESGGSGALAYTKLIMTYLAFAIDRVADFSNTCTRWVKGNEKVMNLFGKQAIAMTWDFPEAASLNEVVGGFKPAVQFISDCILKLPEWGPMGTCSQMDAKATSFNQGLIVSTDPPYYDNIGYADLSDFFYVWLRRSLKSSYPRLLSTLSVPKKDELVATPYRHGSMENAESFFLNGMKEAMRQISLSTHPSYPVTLYYAFKQAETSNSDGETRTGWEAFLQSVIESGLQIVGTWPVRSEQEHRMIGIGKNALASCVVLVCRQRPAVAKIVSRAQFRRQLKEDLPDSIRSLEKCNIAPVDVSQAAIGPGMAIFSEAKAVLNSDDSAMTVREALVEINAALDEYLSQDEGEMDADTRFTLTFYESFGYEERDYGDAESLAMARNVSVDGVAKAGILRSLAGKVRLLHRSELPSEWDPATDKRLCVWEATQQLINYLESKGESEAAALLKKLKDIHGHGDLPSSCRALAYRLYNHCEKAKQADEARSYNGLVIAWPELERQASAASNAQSAPHQPSLI
jgi:putative DNA methylase